MLFAGLFVNGCRISKLLSRPTGEGDGGAGGGGTAISVNPREIVDSALAGDSTPRIASVSVINGGGWLATTTSSWIHINPTTGGSRAQMRLTLDPSSLDAGLHIGVVTIQEHDSTGPIAQVTVSFRIQQPVLDVKPTSLTFTATSSNAVFDDTLKVSNVGDGPLTWSAASEHGAAWLKLSNTQGSDSGKIAVHVSSAGLAQYGTFRETIIVTAPGAKNSPQRINVTLRRRKHDDGTSP